MPEAGRPVFDVETVIAGAGIIGLAIARQLAIAGSDVLLVEAAGAIGTGNSARNSEVIHAGIYYPQSSLKAELCVDGKRKLYDYLETRGIAHKRLGKLIVASVPEDASKLKNIAKRALANGVDDLELLDARAVQKLEPALRVDAGLLSPSTGILDSHGLMLALLGDAEDNGAKLALNTPVERAQALGDGRTRIWCGGSEPCILIAQRFVNATGLGAVALAASMDGFPLAHLPAQHLAKGSYFTFQGQAPFARLIYPVPSDGGLGVHLTLDLAGRGRFGPDIEWLRGVATDQIDYRVVARQGEKFYSAIRTYWPGLPDGSLVPGYAGVRPKLAGPGEPNSDFVISGQAEHGLPGQVHLFGIESPGLTACLAIAEKVSSVLHND